MKIAFRVDASLEIGTGHMVRCLTLAKRMKALGSKCFFISRKYKGNFIHNVKKNGFEVLILPVSKNTFFELKPNQIDYSPWQVYNWKEDASLTLAFLKKLDVDLLIVDHYSLDKRWEEELRGLYKKLMVIDDLADREHACDLLLDHNLVNSMDKRYKYKTPSTCLSLLGPDYALVRSEFSVLRNKSLLRRKTEKLNTLMIFMGGCDLTNETLKVLKGVLKTKIKYEKISVVLGQSYPYLKQIKQKIDIFPNVDLHIQIEDIEQVMLDSDFAITSGGGITWEKCVLGLPSFVITTGKSEILIAHKMNKIGAQKTLGKSEEVSINNITQALNKVNNQDLKNLSFCASQICDGGGVNRVSKILGNL